MAFYVHILASRRNGTIYVGSTDNLTKRIWEHKEGVRPGFTCRYAVKMLVWCEVHEGREGAVRRERRIKEWKRAWTLGLIEKRNPDWRDLYDDFLHASATPAEILFPPIVPAEAGTQHRSEQGSGEELLRERSEHRPDSPS